PLALGHVKRGVPGVEVAHRLRAVAAGGVLVGGDEAAEGGLARRLAATLGVGEEEALVAGQAVDHRRRAAAQGGVIGVISGGEAGQIRDILAEGELAVDVDAEEGAVRVILRRQSAAGLLEMGEVGGGPPVPEAALRVEGGAEIVEAVADLMAD